MLLLLFQIERYMTPRATLVNFWYVASPNCRGNAVFFAFDVWVRCGNSSSAGEPQNVLTSSNMGSMLTDARSPTDYSLFKHTHRNPYLLSNVVGAGLSIVSLPLVLVFLKGTKGAGLGNPP